MTAESFSEKQSFPRAKWRAVAMGGTGIRKQRPSALAEPPGCWHSANREGKSFSRSAAAATSARRREQRLQPGRGKVCGRARRRALCARCSRLVCQVNPRAARHARTHEYLTVHTAWTACSPHVLAGRSQAVELTCNGYIWLYKSWAVACGGGACRGAMACFALSHASTESDRQIDLS